MVVAGVSALLFAFWMRSGPAVARIGGVAQRGDNCTPLNGFAVGFPVAGTPLPAGTIVDQHVVLDRGWRTIGFFLTERNGTFVFAPFNIAASPKDETYPIPPMFRVPSMAPSAILSWYPKLRAEALADQMAGTLDFVQDLRSVTVSPCYAAPLPHSA
ncbi:MAG TPA: hypothetical protein VFB22_11715 [Candidatus Baltobacteraceae bacterium]|nr:hypothetical protein [Candidatus Baltobacteraceae bacterium]